VDGRGNFWFGPVRYDAPASSPPAPAPDIPHPLGELCHQAAIVGGKEKCGQTMTAREIPAGVYSLKCNTSQAD
jgi:hypothetical protein